MLLRRVNYYVERKESYNPGGVNIFVELITNPLAASMCVAFLWLVFHKALIIWKSERLRVCVNLFWLGVAFLAVVAVIIENNEFSKNIEIKNLEFRIIHERKSSLHYCTEYDHCRYYNWSDEYFSAVEIDSLKNRIDSVCQWVSVVSTILADTSKQDYLHSINYPEISIPNPNEEYAVERLMNDKKRTNELVSDRHILIQSLKHKAYREFYRTWGILLLLIAFPLRLALASTTRQREVLPHK